MVAWFASLLIIYSVWLVTGLTWGNVRWANCLRKKGKQAPQEGSDPQYEQTSTGCIATCCKSKPGQPEHVGTPKAAALPVQAFLWDTILIISCHFLKTK